MLEQAYKFQLEGEPIFCYLFGNGHINDTYLLVDKTARQYILQKINKNVFHLRETLMKNISSVTEHLRKSAASSREVLSLIPTKDHKLWLVDEEDEYWRVYPFISDSVCFEAVDSADILRESGVAFGRFQRLLADFPSHTLIETIPDFHNTPKRFSAFKLAVEQDAYGRAKDAAGEIEFVLEREGYASFLTRLQVSGELPLRVVHNDAKLNNVLFDRDTHKALCVIDLDTVMPGYSVNDFGDSIRFGASTAAEDEPDLSKVTFSLPLFEAYVEGFISASGEILTKTEAACLCDGAKTMTFECGMRFLTDYLSGDTYFRTHRDGQNLDRCRTQFKLVREMEAKWPEMQKIVSSFIQY